MDNGVSLLKSVYERPFAVRALHLLGLAAALLIGAGPAQAQTGNDAIVEARAAFIKHDGNRLSVLRATALAEHHPRPSTSAGAAPTSKTGCATTGCSNSAAAAIGRGSPPTTRAFA